LLPNNGGHSVCGLTERLTHPDTEGYTFEIVGTTTWNDDDAMCLTSLDEHSTLVERNTFMTLTALDVWSGRSKAKYQSAY